jgi:sugar fermentation stimulation protein A
MEDVKHFTPNYKTHAKFGAALKAAIDAGVKAVAFDCLVTENSMMINRPIPIKL